MGTSETGHTLTNVDSCNNLLTTSLRKYFAKANRYDRIISFFEPYILITHACLCDCFFDVATYQRGPYLRCDGWQW